jgi:hypothetical protein
MLSNPSFAVRLDASEVVHVLTIWDRIGWGV